MPTWNNTSTGRSGTTQDWTVPKTASYRITAKGARGGYAYLLSTTTINPGGNGAVMAGDFNLTSGHVIRMMVGQAGGDNPLNTRGGGGGGATFVYNVTTATLLMIAGGGGGAGQYDNTAKHATTAANGKPGTVGAFGAGGTAPNGGGAGPYSAGGGGYSGNGANAGAYATGGLSYTNGGTGGALYSDGKDGGYGGGGGSYAGGAGGGGYGGGGGGGWSYSGDGGGGGSYNGGTNQSNVVNHYGHGQVVITENNAPPTAPTGLTPTWQKVTTEAVAEAKWTHNDPNADPQAQHQLRWRAKDPPILVAHLDAGALTAAAGATIALAPAVEGQEWWTAQNGGPIYRTGGQNGHPYLEHSSTGTGLRWATNLSNDDSTVFVVARQRGTASARILSGLSNNWLLGWHNNNEDDHYAGGWVLNSTTPATTNVRVYAARREGGTYSFWRNGTLLASNTLGTASPSGLTTNGYQGASEFSDSDVYEVIVYAGALGDFGVIQKMSDLVAKYGLA